MKPSFKLLGFDHVTFAVGNAKQAAHYYESVYGFDLAGYRGLEQGDRQTASYVLKQNHVTFVLNTPYRGESPLNESLKKHGDGVTDIAFAVDDAAKAWEHTTTHGAKSAFEPRTMEDEHGKVVVSGIHTYGDVTHTFVQREGYKGASHATPFWRRKSRAPLLQSLDENSTTGRPAHILDSTVPSLLCVNHVKQRLQ